MVVIKIPVRNNVKEERFILLIFSEEFQFVTAGKSGWDSSICGFASLSVDLFTLANRKQYLGQNQGWVSPTPSDLFPPADSPKGSVALKTFSQAGN